MEAALYDQDDRRIEDIEALDATGYNWNLIHGTGRCGTDRTPFEGWRCILSAPGLEMAGYDGMTMHRAILSALLAYRRLPPRPIHTTQSLM